MAENKNIAGHLLAILTVILWGTTFISTKVLLRSFTPIEILFIRFVLGFLVLLLIYPHRLRLTDKKQELLFAGAGLCGITLYYLLENIALTYSLASNIGVIVSVAPFFTALLAHRFLDGEKLQKRFFVGFVVAMAGILFITYHSNTALHINPVGDLLALLAAAVWAIYSILTKKISAFNYHTIQTTRRTFFYGLLFMLPCLFIFDFKLGIQRFADPVNLFNMLFLGVGASAVCFATWNFAIRRLGAVKTSVYIYFAPVVTIVTSILVLHERITWLGGIGILLTLTGLLISQSQLFFRSKKQKRIKEEPGL